MRPLLERGPAIARHWSSRSAAILGRPAFRPDNGQCLIRWTAGELVAGLALEKTVEPAQELAGVAAAAAVAVVAAVVAAAGAFPGVSAGSGEGQHPGPG